MLDIDRLTELWSNDSTDVRAILEYVCAFMDDIGSHKVETNLPYNVYDAAGSLFWLCSLALEEMEKEQP